MIKMSTHLETHEEELKNFYKALMSGRHWLQENQLTPTTLSLFSKDLFTLKVFTDNIIVGWPVHDDGEAELAQAFFRLGAFQLQLVNQGYFLRGAISVGDAYIDEFAVFGNALIEAYEGESKLARDPRIILSPSAIKMVKSHLRYYAEERIAPHVSDVLQDTDGQWFLNYLACILWAVDEEGPFYAELELHKQAVERKLQEYKDAPSIWSKYAWAASYHNYFCESHPEHFNDKHKIEIELFRSKPRKIVS
ncbi:hypothetical protein [Permianibacter aggregans]|nr:hypothetical protein [Permianibacter aggregans]